MRIENGDGKKQGSSDRAQEASSKAMLNEALAGLFDFAKEQKTLLAGAGIVPAALAQFGHVEIVGHPGQRPTVNPDTHGESVVPPLPGDSVIPAVPVGTWVEEHLSDGTTVRRHHGGDLGDRVETTYGDTSHSLQNLPDYASVFERNGVTSKVSKTGWGSGEILHNSTEVDGYIHSATLQGDGIHSSVSIGGFTVDMSNNTLYIPSESRPVVTPPANGDYNVRHAHGNTIYSNADGSVTILVTAEGRVETTYRKDGAFERVIQDTNGTVSRTLADGTQIRQFPNGSVVTTTREYTLTQNGDGSIVTRYNSDGRTVRQTPDGTRMVTYADGHTETVQLPLLS